MWGWLETAANRNNPLAMDLLGDWFRDEGNDKKKAVSYFLAAAELEWKDSMIAASKMLRDGKGCAKNFREAVMWCVKGTDPYVFLSLLENLRKALQQGWTERLGFDFDQLCYSLGCGLYWYYHGSEKWKRQNEEETEFGERCLGYYCSCVECNKNQSLHFFCVGIKLWE
jgi:hypothetical protein